MGRRAARARSDRWRGRELEFANAHAERDCVKEGSADAERTPRRRRAGGPTQARSQAGRCTSQFALLQILVATAVLPLLSLRGEDEGKFGERIGGIVEGRAGSTSCTCMSHMDMGLKTAVAEFLEEGMGEVKGL